MKKKEKDEKKYKRFGVLWKKEAKKEVCLSEQHLFKKIKIFDRMAEESKKDLEIMLDFMKLCAKNMTTHVCTFSHAFKLSEMIEWVIISHEK